MFYHVKDLQYNARVSRPDPAFATLLLEQFGGANGELAAALRYFGQAFGAKNPYPDKYDLLMDIATEEFSHLEIVGATIQMLKLDGHHRQSLRECRGGELRRDHEAAMNGKAGKEEVIHQGMVAPQFLIGSAGGPCYSNSQGVPWTAAYINGDATGDLSADLRSNIGAESRAKMVYEYLLQFTEDPYVKETLRFLMTREVAHFQMFEAALQQRFSLNFSSWCVTNQIQNPATSTSICPVATNLPGPGIWGKRRNSGRTSNMFRTPSPM